MALLAYNTISFGSNLIEVQGHRGCRGYFPENTLPSFAAAIEAGVDTIETDLLVTKDGVIVLYHDYYLNRKLCTYWNGKPITRKILIRDLTYAELNQIDCGSKKNPQFPCQQALPGAHIPRIEELFAMVKGKDVRLILEIKRNTLHPKYTFSPEELAKRIMETVKRSGLESQVYYSSFNIDILTEIRKIDPDAKIGLIVYPSLVGAIQIASSLNAEFISPEQSLLHSAEDVQRFHDAGFRVIPWTVNNCQRWQQLIEMGVDGIVTDYPQDLILYLENCESAKQTEKADTFVVI